MPDLLRIDEGWRAGCYRLWKHPIFPGPIFKDTIAILCMSCGRAMCLPNHTIAGDGAVSPSVVCPHGCGWHVFVRLKDWSNS
jgi:hypothetical protein